MVPAPLDHPVSALPELQPQHSLCFEEVAPADAPADSDLSAAPVPEAALHRGDTADSLLTPLVAMSVLSAAMPRRAVTGRTDQRATRHALLLSGDDTSKDAKQ